MRRVAPALLLSFGMLLVGLAPAAAAVAAWQISASPTSFPEGRPTQVVLTVTGGSQPIGLLTVTIPSGYQVASAKVLSAPAGQIWAAAVSSPTLATFKTNSYPERILQGDVARFAITVVATSLSPPAWIAASYQQSATPGDSAGKPKAPLPAFTIVPASTPTPAPTPTPTVLSTPGPSSAPTAVPSPTPAGPSPTPAGPSPTPAGPSPTPASSSPPSSSPTAGPSPSAEASSRKSSAPSTTAQVAAGSPDVSPGSGNQVVIPTLPPGGSVAVSGLDGLSTLSLYSWLVPGFFLGLPGLLIMLVVLFQLGAGGLFVPIVRNVLGGFGLRKRSGDDAAS